MNESKIIYKSPDDLTPYVNNAKKHSAEQVTKVAASIKEFGFTNPVLIDKNNGIIAGHCRVLAAKKLKLEQVPCICLDHLNDTQRKAYIPTDNRLGEIGTEWDMDLVNIELKSLQLADFDISLIGFDFDIDINNTDIVQALNDDVIPEPKDDQVSKLGDIWLLGDHRVMCGDSTVVTDVEKLMDGKKADMVFTDPPYNTGMTAKASGRLSHMFDDAYDDEEWDRFMSDFCSMYYTVMREDSVAYICLDWRRSYELIPHVKKHFKLSNIIVWDKVVHGMGSDYQYVYELIHVCKKGKPTINNREGDREYYDIWHIQRKIGKDEDHATKKPIEIPLRTIRHASKKGDVVLDLFGGSGTTLIAAHQINRKCLMMELSPTYVDVIIKRWQNLTGKDAVLSSNDKTFNELSDDAISR